DGVTALGNAGAGVRIGSPYYYFGPTTSNNIVGGATVAARNLISGNGTGVYINDSAENWILGNYIGTDSSGTQSVGNSNSGIAVYDYYAARNLIGGTNASQRNLISGNGTVSYYIGDGIYLNGSTSNTVYGNYIGVDVTGTAGIPNGQHGVNIQYGS